MNLAKHETERIKQILIKDKLKSPDRFCEILKKEAEKFLKNFFDFEDESTKVSVTVDTCGFFNFYIMGKAKRIHFCN